MLLVYGADGVRHHQVECSSRLYVATVALECKLQCKVAVEEYTFDTDVQYVGVHDKKCIPVICSFWPDMFCTYVSYGHQDARPGVHLVSPGLLQLTAVRHQRRATLTPAVGAERCRPPGHRRQSV